MPGRRDIFDQAMNQGHSAAWDQHWDRAIAAYTAALREIPDDPKALTSLGLALFQSDHFEEALRAYQRAATLTLGDPVAPEKCGEIFEQLGRLNEAAQTYLAVADMHLNRRDVDKAIDNWGRAIRLTPDNLNAHSRLARALEHNGRTREAVTEYLEVARLFQRAKEVDKAAQAATYALQLDPQSAAARDALDKLRKGVALPVTRGTGPLGRSTGRLSSTAQLAAFAAVEAEASAVRSASPIAVAQEAALAKLAEMLFEEDTDTSKTSASIGAITRGTGPLRSNPTKRAQAAIYLGQAINQQTGGNLEAAANNYESALEAGLDHPSVNFMLGTNYLSLNRPDDAVKYLRQATAYEDYSLGAHYALGQAYLRAGKSGDALASLLEALKQLDLQLIAPAKRDRLAETYESLTDALLRSSASDTSKVVQSLMQFLSGENWEERARQARQQLDKSAEGGQVTPLADMLATPGADHILESMRRIEDYMAKHYWATAMEEAYLALEYSPTHLPIHARMAEILIAENKPQVAIVKYAAIADSYRIRGDIARATKVVEDILRLSPLDTTVRGALIDMLNEQGRTEDALAQYMELADTYYQLTDLDTSHSTYTEAVRLAQKSAVDHSWSVRILHRMGDIDMQRLALREAQRVYEQIKALAPDDEKSRATLVGLHFRLGNPKAALAELDGYIKFALGQPGGAAKATLMLEEMLGNRPDDTALVTRLARLYQEQGRKANAIAQYDRLGELYLNAGENEEAVKTIQTLLALGPDNVTDYQQLLAQLQSQR
jgi:tetratricopeptide (TPR) repeat protein